MKGLASFFFVCAWVVFIMFMWADKGIREDKHLFRTAVCLNAGGDGRYELRGGFFFATDLWCSYPDGKLFPVLDPPMPKAGDKPLEIYRPGPELPATMLQSVAPDQDPIVPDCFGIECLQRLDF